MTTDYIGPCGHVVTPYPTKGTSEGIVYSCWDCYLKECKEYRLKYGKVPQEMMDKAILYTSQEVTLRSS